MLPVIYSESHSFPADTVTPVGLYLQYRHRFRKAFLLENNDPFSDLCHSIIGLNPLIELIGNREETKVVSGNSMLEEFDKEVEEVDKLSLLSNLRFHSEIEENGWIGSGYSSDELTDINITSLDEYHFVLFEYLVVIDHSCDQGILIRNSFNSNKLTEDEVNNFLRFHPYCRFPFEMSGADELEFLMSSGKLETGFKGDEFQLYRSFRGLHASPNLYFFDFEEYKEFGCPANNFKVSKGPKLRTKVVGRVNPKGRVQFIRPEFKVTARDGVVKSESPEKTRRIDMKIFNPAQN